MAVRKEYADAAKTADRKHFGTDSGPVTARLAAVGPVVGMAWGRYCEASQSVHRIVQTMAEARVKKQNLAWGRGEELEKGNLSMEISYLRRRLSSAAVTCFGQRLAGRASQVGGQGAALASQRRQQWNREEESARRDREAAWLDKVSTGDIIRRGRFWMK